MGGGGAVQMVCVSTCDTPTHERTHTCTHTHTHTHALTHTRTHTLTHTHTHTLTHTHVRGRSTSGFWSTWRRWTGPRRRGSSCSSTPPSTTPTTPTTRSRHAPGPACLCVCACECAGGSPGEPRVSGGPQPDSARPSRRSFATLLLQQPGSHPGPRRRRSNAGPARSAAQRGGGGGGGGAGVLRVHLRAAVPELRRRRGP